MKHLLIVDDDKTNLTMARNALSDVYRITAVLSGDQALRFLASNIPDLILLDINMPDMDGYEVMTAIRKDDRLQYVPVIFLTADSEAETECRCLEAGAVDFITKPFIPLVMRSRISRILELEELRTSLRRKLDQKIQEVSVMRERSSHDGLTGLLNRNSAAEAVNSLLSSEGNGTLFMIDMDNFKIINDVYGHAAGDSVLKMFARTLEEHSGEGDVICRLGGDEFVMFIKKSRSAEELSALAGAIIEDLTAKVHDAGYNTGTTASVGISFFPTDGDDFASLCHSADKALYFVKQNGKGAFHFYRDEKADDKKRTENLVDLGYLNDYLARSDASNGSYILNLESFSHVYNFIRRIVRRSASDVQTLLFTFTFPVSHDTDYERTLEIFEKAVFASLRRVDVSTRYSGRQILVVLMNADEEDCGQIAGRIMDNFRSIYTGPEVDIRYETERLESKGQGCTD
ncbi:diguanylate cyclase [Ruminococcus sp. HUN007]|uniref:diguanylate cyclase domain-containing protein n=1 Tax=Ruminococcus sp. HUN007 TaxID=1514668 RepID=UPI0005D1D3F3|nr:diguanylate cyclase [Ruminococcus sp. HUN007]